MHKPESILENERYKPLRLWDTNGSPNLGLTIRPRDSQQKREPAIPADHRVKLKESKKKVKYLDLARKLEKNCGTWEWWWH